VLTDEQYIGEATSITQWQNQPVKHFGFL